MAFAEFHWKFCWMEFFKNLSDVCQVFFWSFAEYNDVVQISYCEIEVFQDIGH